MRAYMKFGAIMLAAVGLQVLIDRHHDAVEEAVFVLRTGCVHLIGTEAERQDLTADAKRMLDRRRDQLLAQMAAQTRPAAAN
jgi:predicted xylose isomerase-like sugar epimerase